MKHVLNLLLVLGLLCTGHQSNAQGTDQIRDYPEQPDTLTYDSAKDVRWFYSATRLETHQYRLRFHVEMRDWRYFITDYEQYTETGHGHFASDMEPLRIFYDNKEVKLADSIESDGNMVVAVGTKFQTRPQGYQIRTTFFQNVNYKGKGPITGTITYHILDMIRTRWSPPQSVRFSIPIEGLKVIEQDPDADQ